MKHLLAVWDSLHKGTKNAIQLVSRVIMFAVSSFCPVVHCKVAMQARVNE